MKQTNSGMVTIGVAALFLLAPFAPSQQTPPPGGQPPAAPAGGVAAPAGAPGPQGAGRGGGFGRGGQPFDYSGNDGWLSLFDGQTLNGWDGDTRY
jgi:hypothetical protein